MTVLKRLTLVKICKFLKQFIAVIHENYSIFFWLLYFLPKEIVVVLVFCPVVILIIILDT